MKTVSRILKWTCYVVIASVFFLLIGRIVIADYYPAAMKSYYVSDAMRELATENYVPEVYRQGLRISYDDHDSGKYARFMASNQYYCPELGELQITLRYNRSTLELVAEDFKLDAVPEDAEDLFAFAISDNNENHTTAIVNTEIEHKFMYTYIKLTFTGIDFDSEETGWLRLEICYKDAVDFDNPYATIPVWERELVPDSVLHPLTYQEIAG